MSAIRKAERGQSTYSFWLTHLFHPRQRLSCGSVRLTDGIDMRISRFLAICFFLFLNHGWAETRLSGDRHKLLVLSSILKLYEERSGGRMPTDLSPLRDDADLPFVLRPEIDPLGPFPDRYAFVPTQPWVEVPGVGPRQLLLISVKPFPDGSRGAIWRYRTGEYNGNYLSAKELEVGLKDFNFADLKPMGGGVPAPTHPFPDPPMTDYQAKVMQLVREGKISPQPRNPAGKAPQKGSAPSPIPTEGGTPKMSPVPVTPSPATIESHLPSTAEPATPRWYWLFGILALIGIIAVALKRRA